MSRSDRSLGAEAFDEEKACADETCEDEACEDGAQTYAGGAAPAASLTSIRLSRRRPHAKAPTSLPAPKSGGVTERPERDPSETADSVPAVAVDPAWAQRPSSIVDYWSRLRGERPYPDPAELDADVIAATWPNAMLLRRHTGETSLRAAALYKPEGNPANPANPSDHTLDLSPMVVEWILSLAERTVRSAQPIAEKESFERPRGSIHYAACALPLSDDGTEVDHVLCYLRVLS